jgi:hypothetical protein
MRNPELRRYAWLELGTHRIVIVPAVLAALIVIVASVSQHPAEPVAQGALGVFLALTVGWGTTRAYASVIDEVRDRTWDFQRMAALDPRTLAVGKIFGAPMLAWYVGAWCLAIFVVAGIVAGLPHLFATLVSVTAVAVTLHSLGVAASALVARTAAGTRSRRFGGVLMLLVLLYSMPTVATFGWFGNAPDQSISWWGLHGIALHSFAAASAVVFAAWAAFAAWRAMARELREPAWWWAWPAFAAFTALWWGGSSGATFASPHACDAMALASLLLCAAAYMGLSLDPPTLVSMNRLSRLAKASGTRWHQRLPLWLLHALVSLVLALASVAVAMATVPADSVSDWARFGMVPPVALGAALMVLRDAGVAAVFTLTLRVRKPFALATFYILLADVLLPLLFTTLKMPALARAIFPFWGIAEHPMLPAGGMAIHLAIVLAVLAWRLRRRPPDAETAR